MKLNKSILLLILLVVQGCSDEKSKSKNLSSNIKKNNVFEQFSKVVIKGKTDDIMAFKSFNVIDYSSFIPVNYMKNIEVINDSLFLVIDSIFNPKFLDIVASSKDDIYVGKILVKGNDTILFEVKNKKLKFLGNKANENNFYSCLNDSTPKYIYNSYQGNILKYKKIVDSIYKKKIDFFNQYVKDNNIQSTSFINLVKIDLKYQHLYELLSPRTKQVSNSVYFNDSDALIPIIQKEYSNNEVLFDLKNYLGNITIDDLKNENLIENVYFNNSLVLLIKNYLENSNYPEYSKEKFLAEKKLIEDNFDGKIREFALASLIIIYSQKGFGKSIDNISFLREMIRKYEEIYPKSSFKGEMQEITENLKSFNFELSESALNAKLLDKFGDTLTLKKIYKRSNKRIRVIDFWASWCSPCINEIKKAKNFKDKLAVEKNVEWIYLSIDEDPKKWLKKSKELKEFLNVRNQYLVLNGNKSPLIKSLNVSWIPRYVIINKNNKIMLNNAPRPSDTLIFKSIIDKISNK